MPGRILALTSPHTKGDDVLHLQKLLKSNIAHIDYMPDAQPDGEFGTLTAQAVRRAEYWFGYPTPVQSCGTILPAYLDGSKKLPLNQRLRRAARLRRARAEAALPLRAKAFHEALKHVGTTEQPPGSNLNPFGKWYGYNGVPWCAEFMSYCYSVAGSKNVKRLARWAYCPFIVADARAGRNGLTVTKNPQQGDIVLYDWDNDGVADHVGLFDKWVVQGSSFASVEGNTSPTNASNGGQVVHYGTGDFHARSVTDVICFAHLAT
jgi:hypothetical protein